MVTTDEQVDLLLQPLNLQEVVDHYAGVRLSSMNENLSSLFDTNHLLIPVPPQ